jgi:hypothetical protein
MKKYILAWAALSGLVPITTAAVPTVYSYTGLPYTSIHDDPSVAGSYTTSMSIIGSITLNEALAPDTSVSLDGEDPRILSFSFHDGRFTYDQWSGSGSFTLDTDNIGRIRAWEILVEGEVPGLLTQAYSFSHHIHTVSDSASHRLPMPGAGIDFASSYVTGSWTVTPPVPEPSKYALFIAGIVLLGFVAKKRTRYLKRS